MMLTCAKCGRRHPLSDDDVAFFHPRFFCLSCGEKLPFQVDEKTLAQLRLNNDRSRRLSETDGQKESDTSRHVDQRSRPQGMDGG